MTLTTGTAESAKIATNRIRSQWWAFVTAVQFLTRIPLSARMPTANELRDCPRYFPLVATSLGVLSVATIWSSGLLWPLWIAVAIAMVVEFRLTGGFHEDAVADVCDGFGGAWEKQRVLEIMQDSRIGTYGTLGLISAVSLRFATTIAVIERIGAAQILGWGVVLIASAVLGRWLIVLSMVWVPSVSQRDSLSRDIGARMSYTDLSIATLASLPILIPLAILFPLRTAIALILLLLAALWFKRLVMRKIGGITGDCLGFIGYCGQLIVLLVAAAGGGQWTLNL